MDDCGNYWIELIICFCSFHEIKNVHARFVHTKSTEGLFFLNATQSAHLLVNSYLLIIMRSVKAQCY